MRLLLALIGISISAIAIGAERVEVPGMQGLGHVEFHLVTARNIDQDYYVFVGLPDGYADSGDRSYPTIYLLDGGWNFPLLWTYQRWLRYLNEVPEAILVGISYGADIFESGNNRSTDYTAAASEREFWGGAGRFQSFLSDQLFPFVEENYRSDRDRRIIFGHSLGGQFVLYTAQTRPDLFWGHIATNPALHRNLPFFLEQHGEGTRRTQVFVASASEETPRFKGPTLEWIDYWSGKETTPWDLKVMILDGHTHLSANPAAYRQGMIWLFSRE